MVVGLTIVFSHTGLRASSVRAGPFQEGNQELQVVSAEGWALVQPCVPCNASVTSAPPPNAVPSGPHSEASLET